MDDDRSLLDDLAIRRLHARYGDAVTRRAWTELTDLFVPGCAVELDLRDNGRVETTGPDGIVDFVARAVERFSFFEFVVLNVVAEVDGDRASGRLYLQELRQDAATDRWSTAFGLYRDELARVDGAWRYAHRRYSSLARSAADAATPAMVVFPLPQPAG